MLNFNDFNIQTLTTFLSIHPYVANIFTYFIAFAEAMAVIGVIIPGVIAMPAIGFLIGSDIIPAGPTFLYAIFGAITGDCVSYFLGIYFKNRIHRIWPFTRWPKLLTYSEKFFRAHGGKSVFIGRFVGLARAMIPMVAGMFKMPFLRFLVAAVPSAIIWSVGYMVPGILLGALSLELPPKIAAEFALWSLVVFSGIWLVVWLVQHYFKQIWQMLDYYIMQTWKYFQRNKNTAWVIKFLSDPKEPDNHQQLTLVIVAVLLVVLFLLVLHQVLISGVLVDFGNSIYHLLTSLRLPILDYIFILFTLLGDIQMLVIACGIIFLWLVWKRYWYVAIHCLGLAILSIVIIAGMRYFVYFPRPGDILYYINVSSFPSAHAVLSTATYGFLAAIIARELKATKKILAYGVVGSIVGVVSFSRIYLGAHWLVDVLGGILLGLVMLIIVTVSYRRRHIQHFKVRKFILAVTTIFTVVWLGYALIDFNQQAKAYTLIWPKQIVTFEKLVKQQVMPEIPLYRLNRLGEPIQAFNVIYVGDLETISQALIKKGWESQPTIFGLQSLAKSFIATSVANHLTIFPQLYHNRKGALLFTKNANQDDTLAILHLWLSDIDPKDSDSPLWIGSIEYHHAELTRFSLKRHKKKNLFIGATEFMAEDLTKGFYLWRKKYSPKQQPQEMRDLLWDGKLLIIRSKESY